MIGGIMVLLVSQTSDFGRLMYFPAVSLQDKGIDRPSKLADADETRNLRLLLIPNGNKVTVQVANYSVSSVPFSTKSGELQAWFEVYDGKEWLDVNRLRDSQPGFLCGTCIPLRSKTITLPSGYGWTYRRTFPEGEAKVPVRWKINLGKKTMVSNVVELTTKQPRSIDHGQYQVSISKKG